MNKNYLQIIFISMFLFLIISVTAQESEGGDIVVNSIFIQEGQKQLYQIDLSRNIQERPRFEGYIIQLNEDPLIPKIIGLEVQAGINSVGARNFFANIFAFILPRALGPTTPSNLQAKIQTHTNDIQQEHLNFKQNVLQTLGKSQFSVITGNVISNEELSILGEYKNIFNGIALNITTEEANLLKELDEVKEVYLNYIANISLSDSVPLINADDVWLLDTNGNNCEISDLPCLTGQEITIGIIDTGVDYTHEDLGGCIPTTNINDGSCSKVVGGYDFINNDNDPMDDQGHGTHVAATAAGNGVLKGVAPDAKIYAYKVLSSSGSGSFSGIIAAIERSVDPNQDGDFSDRLDIISLSIGGPGNPDDPVSQAIDNIVDAGVIAVVAAGNSGPSQNTIGSPGTARKAITVGATDKNNNIVSFSSRGPVVWNDVQGKKYLIKPDVTAPGVSICAAQWDNAFSNADTNCNNDNNHVAISGTSMATPHVAGAVALLLQKNPGWTPIEIKIALRNTAIDIGEEIITQGYGRIDTLESINIQNKPPIAILETSGLLDGAIDVIGTAAGENFISYSLFHGHGLNPVNWILFHSSSTSVVDGILFSGLDSLSEGENILRLVVESMDGQISEDRIIVIVTNIKLTNPLNNDVIRLGDTIDITGTVKGTGLQNYIIEYSGENPTEWFTAGISLINDGQSEITEGLLGTLDTSVLSESGFYTIRLTVNYGDRQVQGYIRDIYFDSTLKQGWPKRVEMSFDEEEGFYYIDNFEPVVADINNDGYKEIIVYRAGNLPKLNVYKYDGSLFWSKEIGNVKLFGRDMNMPIVGDLNGDGFKEILVIGQYDDQEVLSSILENKQPIREGNISRNSMLYALDYNGDIINGFPTKLFGIQFRPTLIMADLNLNGNKEIVIQGSNKIIILSSNGEVISQWYSGDSRESLVGSTISSPAVGNFDEDDDLEIVIATFRIFPSPSKTKIFIYNMDGSIVNGWPVEIVNSYVTSSPSVGDINNDGFEEIIIGLTELTNDPGGAGLYIFDRNGNYLKSNSGIKFQSSALADLDNDGNLEIATTSLTSSIYLLQNDGRKFSGWPKNIGGLSFYSPLIADINNDGFFDIISSSENRIYAWNTGGILISGFHKITETSGFITAPPTVEDIDNDGKLDLIATSNTDFDAINGKPKYRSSIYVWELNSDYNPSTMPWPMFQHDLQRTGLYTLLEDQIEIEIEAKVKGDKTIVKVKIGDEIQIFTLDVTSREEVIMEIVRITGLSEEQVRANLKFEEELPEEQIECSDETFYGECSTTKPKYCSRSLFLRNYILIDNCSECDCSSSNEVCQDDGSCVVPEIKIAQCSDETFYGECSTTKPKYCSGNPFLRNYILTDNCSECGCSSFKELCKEDGSCVPTF